MGKLVLILFLMCFAMSVAECWANVNDTRCHVQTMLYTRVLWLLFVMHIKTKSNVFAHDLQRQQSVTNWSIVKTKFRNNVRYVREQRPCYFVSKFVHMQWNVLSFANTNLEVRKWTYSMLTQKNPFFSEHRGKATWYLFLINLHWTKLMVYFFPDPNTT